MKVMLKEQKEKMPLSVVTSFISRGWDEVGSLSEMIKTIKASFTQTGQIEDYLQNIVDAYLVCIGQMETFLHDKNYVDIPALDPKKVKESLIESGSIANLGKDGWQRQVDNELAKYGRLGGATYDDLDRDGFYVDADNKVQLKVPEKVTEGADVTKYPGDDTTDVTYVNANEDWVIDWTVDDHTPAGSAASGTAVIDTNPTPEEIAAAKQERGGGYMGGQFVEPRHAMTTSSAKEDDDFFVDFTDDFPEPSAKPLTDDEIMNLQGVSLND